ncbi:MAG: rod shape-determining protein MreD [Oceanihabitans sp.]
MNRVFSYNIARFILLVLVQIVVLNHINFMGYINPYLYVLFILLFPVKNNRTVFLLLSFLLGITIDMFVDSGGIHAAACVTIAYLRPAVLKFCFGTVYEYQNIKFNQIEFGPKITYISVLVLLHHFILFVLEFFNFSQIILLLQKTLFSSIFTIILCVLISILFSKKSK